jgi:hypothetical protein
MHRPGDSTRQFDVRALRAWVAAGRPAQGPRDWHHNRPRRHVATATTADRWPWWMTLGFMVAVIGVALLAGASKMTFDERPTGYIRPMINTTMTQESTP